MMRALCQILTALLLAAPALAQDPIRIEGPEQSRLNGKLPDGGLPPVVGVGNFQVFRASRSAPELTDGEGFTYNHHVDIACWAGWLYVAWDNGRKDEDTWPAREVYSTSADGVSWTSPAELFPMGMSNPLRMYFYHAPNGRMLAIAARRVARGKITNATQGGVVVRELLADHTLGPVYTLIKSPSAQAGPPFFFFANDPPFAQACGQLLADHTFLEQQDHGALLNDQKMKPYDGAASDFGKAFCFFHRKDGTLVGICKKGWVVRSSDNGLTWSQATQLRQFTAGTAKEWIQRTSDGRFAWAHDPFPVDRFPLAVLGGDDGITFGDMRIVHGEVPRQRYAGLDKNIGPQYVRGISEWNTDGSRTDRAMWLAYSVNKEDIWVSRIPIPLESEGTGWNLYVPKWADVSAAGSDADELLLEDHDPYDYARADRVFPPRPRLSAQFELMAKHPGPRNLEIELWGEFNDARPARIVLKGDGDVEVAGTSAARYAVGQWIKFQINADAKSGEFEVSINGAPATHCQFADPTDSLDRLVFRTGEYRLLPTRGNEVPAGSDRPTESSQYLLRGVTIR
ncbi:MAG: hypothetical protein ABSC42_17650 [Tepidisphaeraceae bacterium]|jgi:hypothetical protein